MRATNGIKNLSDVLASNERIKILLFCEGQKMLNQVTKEIGLSRGATQFHIKVLKKFNLVKSVRKTDEKGRPTYITTNQKGRLILKRYIKKGQKLNKR